MKKVIFWCVVMAALCVFTDLVGPDHPLYGLIVFCAGMSAGKMIECIGGFDE